MAELSHWDLQIPVRVTLSPSEISSPTAVGPVYLMAHRQAYLSNLGMQALPFVQHVLMERPGGAPLRPWFEYKGLPLKWTVPIGALFDLACDAQPQQRGLPWGLTLHYHSPPASLTAWENDVTPREHFFNSLKEAAYICKGSEGSGAVMRMASTAQDGLWQAVGSGQGAAIRQAVAALRVAPAARQGQGPYIPVRAFIRSHGAKDGAGVLSLWEDTFSTSRPVEALQPDGSSSQLIHLLRAIAPKLFARKHQAQAAARTGGATEDGGGEAAAEAASAAGGEAGDGEPSTAGGDPLGAMAASSSAPATQPASSSAAAAGAASSGAAAPQLPPGTRVLVSGIEPPLQTPLAWLHANMHSPDLFLYVVVHCKAH